MRTAPRVQLLESAARTAAPAPIVFSGPTHYRGVRLLLNITAASGTGGLKVVVSARSGGAVAALNTGGSNQTTTGLKVYEIYPNAATAAAGIVDAVSRQLPDEYQVEVTHADGSSYTYSLAMEKLL